MRRRILGVCVVLTGLSAACASRPSGGPTFTVEPDGYAAAFEAAKEVLRDERFALDRVDASAGVLTTHAKTTSGLATPWDGEQTTFGQEVEDLLNRQQRRVRITFGPAVGGEEAVDPRAVDAGAVEVTVERINRRVWRPSSASITRSSFAVDPAAGSAPARSAVTVGPDADLAARLARRIEAALRGQQQNAPREKKSMPTD